jgi:hypothetical protein
MDDNPESFLVFDDGDKYFKTEQDVQPYLDYAKMKRDMELLSPRRSHYRSFAIIPDIVAIDILTKYGLDIHAPEFMHDQEKLRRYEKIIQTEYPHLLTHNIIKG